MIRHIASFITKNCKPFHHSKISAPPLYTTEFFRKHFFSQGSFPQAGNKSTPFQYAALGASAAGFLCLHQQSSKKALCNNEPATVPKIEPLELGDEQGKLGVDLSSLVQTLGASMYGVTVAETAVKELLQNAFDAVKEAEYHGLIKEGDIHITFDKNNRTITVKDNGIGMSPKIVRDAFFTIGGSHKGVPHHLRSGGYGQAKIAFLMNVSEVSLETTRDGITTKVTTNPSELISNNFTISHVLASSEKEHGTTVTVRIPDTCIVNGEEKSVTFYHYWTCYTSLKNPLIGNTKVTVTNKSPYGRTEQLPSGSLFNKSIHSTLEFPWGSVVIYASPQESSYPDHHVLASGVTQFSTCFLLPDGRTRIPLEIILDIKPNVSPSDLAYPIANNRAAFKKHAEEDIEKIRKWLQLIHINREQQATRRIFQTALCIPPVQEDQNSSIGNKPSSKTALTDSNKQDENSQKRLSRSLRKRFIDLSNSDKKNRTIQQEFLRTFRKTFELDIVRKEFSRRLQQKKQETLRRKQENLKRFVEGRQKVGNWTLLLQDHLSGESELPKTIRIEDLDTEIARSADITPVQCPSDWQVFVNNTKGHFPLTQESQELFAGIASIFHEMKEAVDKSGLPGYDHSTFRQYRAGILIDTECNGIMIPAPYPCVLVNPLGHPDAQRIESVRRCIVDTMIHEIAHTNNKGKGHGVDHNLTMKAIMTHLSDQNKLSKIEDKLTHLLTKHEKLLFTLRSQHSKAERLDDLTCGK